MRGMKFVSVAEGHSTTGDERDFYDSVMRRGLALCFLGCMANIGY